MTGHLTEVTRTILEWAEANPRNLPWKDTKDPYRIWVSEIMLQQTQVAQGIQYYSRFLDRFPTVHALAEATEDEVLNMWQGLGYNSRARNMHQAAKTIVSDYHGVFPDNYDDIRALKGVGEYTAAAVGSFAFDIAVPVLDTNVIRLLCRLYGVVESPAERKTRDKLYAILDRLMLHADPACFNQAMMDFGALQCKARNPDCTQCPLSAECIAYGDDTVTELPTKAPRKSRRKRHLHYFVIRNQRQILITRRTEKDIWEKMYDFPHIETNSDRIPVPGARKKLFGQFGFKSSGVEPIGMGTQVLTHQEIVCFFYEMRTKPSGSASTLRGDARFELLENLENFAFPKVIRTFLERHFFIKIPTGINT